MCPRGLGLGGWGGVGGGSVSYLDRDGSIALSTGFSCEL